MARSALAILLLALGSSLVAAPGSRAAFPGDNGRIVFSVEPNPRSVYMVRLPAPYGLYVVEPDGSDVRPLRLGVQGVGWSPSFSEPAWSPDGSEIVYVHYEGGRGGSIDVMNADGSGRRVVVPPSPTGPGDPAWSPDGSLVAFTGVGPTGNGQVRIVGADGQGPRLVVDEGQQAAWSPDCSRLAFLPGPIGDPGPIRIVDVRGRGRSLAEGYDPNWSPDGRHIAFWRGAGVVGDQFKTEVRVIGADGSGERLLAYGREPAWSPDGREIVYSTQRGLAVTPVQGGAARRLTNPVLEYHWEPDWQPLRGTSSDPSLCAAWRDPVQTSPPLELSVRPRRAPVGRATRFRFRVTAGGEQRSEAVPGAIVRFAGVRRTTDAHGRAVASRGFRRPGPRHLRASKPGFSSARATVRIVKRRRPR